MGLLLFLLLLFYLGGDVAFSKQEYMDAENIGRKPCRKSESNTWGAHNVLPNLYEKVYQPFLDFFTFSTMCRHPHDAMTTCMQFPETGPFEDRCASIGVTSVWHYYILLVQHFSAGPSRYGWNLYAWWPFVHSRELDDTLETTQECDILIRRADADFRPRRECPRSTLAYQCAWNNAIWIVLPLVAIGSVFSITALSLCFSLCMLGSE